MHSPPSQTPALQADRASADVVIVGAGVVGLCTALSCADRGWAVTVVDPAPASGASHAAAGMLAPVTEAHIGEGALLALNQHAAAAWPAFLHRLTSVGVATGHRATGTLLVAHDADDRRAVLRLRDQLLGLGLAAVTLNSKEIRSLEPLLAPDVRGGLYVEGDHSVHNRTLLAGLIAALRLAGVRFEPHAAVAVTRDRVDLDDGRSIGAGAVVVSAGVASSHLLPLPLRPLKGQILRLRTTTDTGAVLGHTLRAVVAGSPVYAVPRVDGEIVVGATMEDRGYNTSVTAGGVWELLRDIRIVLPIVTELEFVEAWAGLRPATPDNLPLVGRWPSDHAVGAGVLVATGHGRNGILQGPATGAMLAALIAGESVDEAWRVTDPHRHSPVAPVAVG